MQRLVWPKIALSLAGILFAADAQESDRIFPILQLTDRDVAEIDVTDGSVGDWEYIFGEPTLTPLDFAITTIGSYDPADMDFRIWLAWHDATDRIFFAMERVDDVYVNEFDREDEWMSLMSIHDSSVMFAVDGDHSGGELLPPRSSRENMLPYEAQLYQALGEVFDEGLQVLLFPRSNHVSPDWFNRPPFAHGGGAVFGESPIFSVTEFYVTPYDLFVWTDPGDSDLSDLFAGKIIGFNIEVYDVDSQPEHWGTVHLLAGRTSDELGLIGMSADDLADGVLMTPDGSSSDDSAVESVTWARIKAGLSE